MVTKNVGKTDKIIRFIIGIIAIAIAVYYGLQGQTTIAIISGVIALVSIVTGFMSFCGVYALLGINTCPLEDR